jgi:membrane protein
MRDIWTRINEFFVGELWGIDIATLGRLRAFYIRALRLIYVGVREFSEGQLTLRAMSLVYTTLLSLVPLLAVSFSVLKAFGVHNQVEPLLENFLAPLGPKGAEVTQSIIGFVDNMKVGILGSIGLGLLVYTVISLIHKIETSVNYIWKITSPRSFARRFSDYMSVIIIGPVLVFSALGLTASVMSTTVVQKIVSIQPFGLLVYFGSKLVPYILVCAAFTFIYVFVPNTKVRFRSALAGGVFAGVLWETAGWAFASFIISSTKYAAIYSGFAILIMFMIWLYLSWLILLVGAGVAFYHQHPQFLTARKEVLRLSNKLKEKLALLIMFLIGESYYHDTRPWTVDSLVTRLGLPVEPIQDVITVLEKKGLVVETGDDPPAYLPERDIETIRLTELLSSVRTAEEETFQVDDTHISAPQVDRVIKRIEGAIGETLGEETLKGLVLAAKEEGR